VIEIFNITDSVLSHYDSVIIVLIPTVIFIGALISAIKGKMLVAIIFCGVMTLICLIAFATVVDYSIAYSKGNVRSITGEISGLAIYNDKDETTDSDEYIKTVQFDVGANHFVSNDNCPIGFLPVDMFEDGKPVLKDGDTVTIKYVWDEENIEYTGTSKVIVYISKEQAATDGDGDE
jgi:hypothetical protein